MLFSNVHAAPQVTQGLNGSEFQDRTNVVNGFVFCGFENQVADVEVFIASTSSRSGKYMAECRSSPTCWLLFLVWADGIQAE